MSSIKNSLASPKIKFRKYTHFIGVDVSRNKLDYAVVHGKELLLHSEGPNEPEKILAFVKGLEELPGFKLPKALFCMEHTGFYCNHLLATLKQIKAHVVLEHPLEIKNSLGVQRGKTDKADAIRIALYAQKNKDDLKLWVQRRPVIVSLMSLFAVRNRLLGIGLVLKTPLQEQATFITKQLHLQSSLSCKKSVKGVESDLAMIEERIDQLISADGRLNRLNKLIRSVSGVGRITAIQFLISTNEFRDISNPKKFACYAGVAPFRKESGLMARKARISIHANKKMKTLLHICALSAIRCDQELKAYFERKTKTEGKHKMAVFNAVRYKLVIRVFACVNQDRCYRKQAPLDKLPAMA